MCIFTYRDYSCHVASYGQFNVSNTLRTVSNDIGNASDGVRT